MPLPVLQRISGAIVGRHGAFDIIRHEIEGIEGPRIYYTLSMPDWVSVAGLTKDGRIVLARQFRLGIEAETIETAGGIVDEGETPPLAARRELREETGYLSSNIESLGWVHPNPGMQNNRCHLFLARDCDAVGDPAPDEDEHTEPMVMDIEEARNALKYSVITHALSILTLSRALERIAATK